MNAGNGPCVDIDVRRPTHPHQSQLLVGCIPEDLQPLRLCGYQACPCHDSVLLLCFVCNKELCDALWMLLPIIDTLYFAPSSKSVCVVTFPTRVSIYSNVVTCVVGCWLHGIYWIKVHHLSAVMWLICNSRSLFIQLIQLGSCFTTMYLARCKRFVLNVIICSIFCSIVGCFVAYKFTKFTTSI